MKEKMYMIRIPFSGRQLVQICIWEAEDVAALMPRAIRQKRAKTTNSFVQAHRGGSC